ncbi:MAG: PDZ domain-containing protein [Deltaproteobacteria bacterium]|nr:PDZ domain-containing protein [Deltaproteobacteria bacterium]
MLGKILKIKPFIVLLTFLAFLYSTQKLRAQASTGGIGVILEHLPDKKIHRIRAVFKESPAARARIVAGEEIVSVDGSSTQGMSFEELGKKIKGAIGSSVSLELKDPKTQSLRKVQLIRSSSQNVSPLIVKDTPPLPSTNNANALTDQEREEVKNIIRKLTTQEQKNRMNDLLLEFKNGKLIKGDFLQILRKTF